MTAIEFNHLFHVSSVKTHVTIQCSQVSEAAVTETARYW